MIADHWSTFRNAKTRRFLKREVLLQLVLPIGAALAAWHFAIRVNDAGSITAGAGILSGFLFGLAIYVFQLRVQLVHDPRVSDVPARVLVPQLIDELFANVMWAVAVSFALTFLALAVGAVQPRDKAGTLIPTDPCITALLVLVAAHLIAVVAMCIRRTRRAYVELTR